MGVITFSTEISYHLIWSPLVLYLVSELLEPKGVSNQLKRPGKVSSIISSIKGLEVSVTHILYLNSTSGSSFTDWLMHVAHKNAGEVFSFSDHSL